MKEAIDKKITILVADDHPLFRDGMLQLLAKEDDFEVVGQASDGEEAVRLAREKAPDVVIMDIEMPNIDGIDATRQIKATHTETSVLVLTAHDDEEYIAALLEAGAAGYLLKTTYGKALVQAIHEVYLGEFVLDTRIGTKVFRAFTRYYYKQLPPNSNYPKMLSDSEKDLAKLVSQGMTNKEISQEMGIGLRDVKGCLSNIFSKLGVSSRVEVATYCLRSGIFSLDDVALN